MEVIEEHYNRTTNIDAKFVVIFCALLGHCPIAIKLCTGSDSEAKVSASSV